MNSTEDAQRLFKQTLAGLRVLAASICGDDSLTDALRGKMWDAAHTAIAEFIVASGSTCPLDLGTSSHAGLARALAAIGRGTVVVTTIDNDPHNVDWNSTTLGPNIFAVHGELSEPLHFQDGIFDGATSSFCFEYLSNEEIARLFAELARVLAPGSPIGFATYGSPMMDEADREFDDRTRFSVTDEDWSFVHAGLLLRLLECNGFVDLRVSYPVDADSVDPDLVDLYSSRVITGRYCPRG